ncbi:hypothetical protein BGX34_005615 [Mortierella sp. NVP85]|nr:hypothetical protein BGX34_005615 [Mortierella sp. NVP85]
MNVDETHQPSLGFSNAYGTDVSIPTSKFNTEAFGPLSVRFIPTSTPQSGMTGVQTATGAITDEIDEIDDFDDLELPGDFDDDFMLTEVVGNKSSHGLEFGTTMSQTGPSFGGNQPPPSQNGVQDINMEELVMLKHRLAEMENKLKSTQEELMIKSGQASVLKDRLETESQAHSELKEKFRTADAQHRSDLNDMMEKHRLALENANIKHQFEVQGFLASRPSNVATPSSTQLSRLLPPPPSPTPQFPKSQTGFASIPSSVKVQPRSDDGFSIHNFAGTPRAPKKSRSIGPSHAVEKPRSPQATGESSKTSWELYTLSDDIPTYAAEDIIRDKLLAGHEHKYGLADLLVIEADAEQVSPLPGSQEYNSNVLLEQLTEACRIALCRLTLVVDESSRSEALKRTTDLLQASLIIGKPHHTVNTLQVLTTLYCTYEDLADVVCRGSVPFLESEEDAFNVVPSESSLPSALACILHLFLTRITLPPQTSTDLAFPAMRKDCKLTKEAEDHLDATLFLFMKLIATHQLASKTISRTFLPLIRKRVFNTMLELHLEKKNYHTLNRILEIMSIVTCEAECSRLFIGWSITEKKLIPSTFSRLGTIIDLIGIQTTDPLDMVNGVIPQIKIRTLEILNRFLRINAERTNVIVFQTNLVRTTICLIRDSVEQAVAVNFQRKMASVWYQKDLQNRFRGGSDATKATTVTLAGAAIGTGSITVKKEPLGQRSSALKLADVQQSTNPMTTATGFVTGAAGNGETEFPLPSQLAKSSFSNFQDPMFEQAHYKPSSLIKPRTGTMTDGVGSREVAAALVSNCKTFDYMNVLRMAMELVMQILRSVEGYSKHLCDKQSVEYRMLGFAVSKVVVLDLGLPTLARELANDVLNDLVLDEDDLEYFLDIVKDIDEGH